MNIFSITKRELKSYFSSLIAYTVIATFLAVSGYFYYTNMVMFVMFVGSDVRLGLWQQTFYDMRFVLVSLIPLLTMRLFAEEKKLGTIELLFTNPLRDADIIIGKYLACVLVLMLMILLTFLYPALLAAVFSLDPGPVAAGYLGIFLMGAACIACGIFLSSLTENQIVAVVITFGLGLMLWLVSVFASSATGATRDVINYLSVISHLDDFIKGVIDTSHIIYYLTFAFVGLFLAYRSLESMRWKG